MNRKRSLKNSHQTRAEKRQATAAQNEICRKRLNKKLGQESVSCT
jgi:hypothetical protein